MAASSAFSRADRVGEGDADEDRDGGNDERVAERFQADAPQLPNIADPGHADDERGKNQRDHNHEQQAKKKRADGFGDVGDGPDDPRIVATQGHVRGHTGRDADAEPDQDAGVERHALRRVGRGVVEVGRLLALVSIRRVVWHWDVIGGAA